MTVKRLSYITLTLIIVLGIAYYKATSDFMTSSTGDIDAGYFPKLLTALLIILSVISLIQTFMSTDEKLSFSNIGLVILTIVLTIVYFAIWSFIGFFYPLTFLFLVSLFMIYKEKPIFDRGLITIIVLSLTLTIIIYVAFDLGMSIQL